MTHYPVILSVKIKMETRFDELKRYVRFTDDDARRLAALRSVAEPHFRRIAQEFYERIREHEDAHAALSGEDQLARLHQSLIAWLERLLGGRYDESYFEQTAKIGRVHVQVGLPQRYMFTAMALIRSSLVAIIDAELSDDVLDARDALGRLLDLELAIMVESYREDLIARIEHVAQADREALSRRAAAAEDRYARAVELADAVMIGLAASGEIVLFNPEAVRVTGYAQDEALGQRFVDLLLPPHERDAHAAVFMTPPKAASAMLEVSIQTRAGKLREMRLRAVSVPAKESSPMTSHAVAMVVTGHDMTDERAMRQQVQQQERLAAVGTLAAGLAHEIRNPLNGAQLHIAFLERALNKRSRPNLDAETRDALEAVGVVRDELGRLARLVTDFLDFARPRPLTLEPTKLRDLCARAIEMVTPQVNASTAPIAMRVDLPTTDLVLAVDRDKLEQVLLNLLLNSIEAVSSDARPAPGGTIVLRARREPRHVWIEVEDDGPGLAKSDAPIFDAFFSTKPHGTGLGLSIAHRVVTDHGGTIDVESSPGRTRFRVTLPLSDQGVR